MTTTVLTAYTYDPLGRRIQKLWQSNRTTLYTYAGQQAIEERTYGWSSATPFSKKELIFTNQIDDLIATYNTTLSTGTTTLYYYESDHLGSIESVYDATAWLVETYEYDVFGNVISRDATGEKQKLKNTQSSNTRLYTGREYDHEINLYYNRARYYDSQMWKFISRDPIGIADDVNLYSYVGNSPMMFVDRFGTLKKFIAENEGNAWYFESWNGFETGHAALYFIDGGQEYFVDFYPWSTYLSDKSSKWNIFSGEVNGLIDFNEIGMYRDFILDENEEEFSIVEFSANNINTSLLAEWHTTEYVDISSYNTFTNNCSDQVEEALNAAWFFETTSIFWIPTPLPGNFGFPWTTPWGLGYDIRLELFYKNLFN